TVAVLPSFVEAFANVPLEAMSYGCPVVFTRRASGPELIEHEKNGLLVDPADIDDIASATIRILKDEALAERLGLAGQQRVRELFSLPTLMQKSVEVFEDSLTRFRNQKI